MKTTSRTLLVECVILIQIASLFPILQFGQSVSYKPPLLPLEMTWSARNGLNVRFLVAHVITLIGQFSFSISSEELADRFSGRKVLAIIVGKKTYIYDLNGEDFRLQLPNNIRGRCVLEYQNGNIRLYIPNPEKLSEAPVRLNRNRHVIKQNLISGTFTIDDRSSFSFSLNKPVGGYDGDLYLFGASIKGYRVMHLGARSLSSIKSISPLKNTFQGSRLYSALTGPFSKREGIWNWASGIHQGHSYAVCLGPNGPYAVIQILNFTYDNGDAQSILQCRYKFNPDGSIDF